MKRILSMLLVLTLLFQVLPVQALAEAVLALPSASELAAARELTGLAEDAPSYHAGMSVSAAMNAVQLSGWLDELLDNDMYSLQQAYHSIQTTLERMKAEDPNYYGIMTDTDNNRPYPQHIEQLHHQSEELREELAFYSHRLTEQSYVIDSMLERLNNDAYLPVEQARAARKLENAVATIRDIRDTVVQQAAGWESQIDTWMSILRGDYIGEDQETFVESSWVYLVMEWNPIIAQAQVSASSITPKGTTLLERLSPVRSALADTQQDVTLNVISQKNFAVAVNEGSIPVQYGGVIANQGDRPINGTKIQTGVYSFNVSDFQANADGNICLDLTIASPLCRSVHLKGLDMKRGQVLTFSLKRDNGNPYVLGAALDDNDILHSQYGIYYSAYNDWERNIAVTITGIEEVICYCALEYTDASSGERVRTAVQKLLPNAQDVTATFRGKWNQLLKPGADLVILLSSSPSLEGAESFPTMLTVQRGAVEQPLFDTTNAFSSAFNPMGSGILSFTLPNTDKMPKFIAGSTLSLELPFSQYMPRVAINMDGSFSFSVGYEAANLDPHDTVNANGEQVARWKTQDQRDLEKSQQALAEQGSKFQYLANAGAMWDGCKSKPVRFLGSASASVSVFMYLYGRYQHDDEGYGSIKAKGGMGVSFSFSTNIMQTIGPVFVNVGLTASVATAFQLGLTLDTYWPQGGSLKLGKLKLDDGLSGITLMLRLQVDISVGLGIKGLLSVSVHGYGYISVLLELLGHNGAYVTVSGRAGFYVLVQVFWLKWQITLYDLNQEVILYTNKKKTSDNTVLRILEPFLPSAVAEASPAQDTVSLTPTIYPKLEVNNAQTLFSDVSMADGKLQLLTLNGEPFALYLEKESVGSHVYRSKLKWVNLNHPEKSGDFNGILNSHGTSEPIIYDFVVDKVHDPKSNEEVGVLCLLATRFMKAVPAEPEDGTTFTMQVPTSTVVYYIGFTAEDYWYGNVNEEFFGSSDLTMWEKTYMEPTITLSSKLENDVPYCYIDISALPVEQQGAGRQIISRLHMQCKKQIGAYIGMDIHESLTQEERFLYNAPNEATCYQVQQGSPELLGQERNNPGILGTKFDSVYALVCESDSPLMGETQLIHHTNGMGSEAIELDRGQIRYYRALTGEVQETSQTDMLFYLAEEEMQGKVQCRLKGIRVVHGLSDTYASGKTLVMRSATLTDYDVIVPASSFDIATISGTTYLYWLEAIEPDSAADVRRYRLCAVVYDPVSDSMSDDFVLAEFVPEHSDDEPQKITLTGDGKGYYLVNRGEGDSATATLYRFPFQYVPSLDLKKVVLADTLVTAGSYNDLVFTLVNDGNTAISNFDLQLQLLENGSSTTVQTIHADIASPNQSYSQTALGTVNGEQSIYRIEDAAESLVQSQWYIQRTQRQYTSDGQYTEQVLAESAENGQLLPGMMAAFKTSLWIPADWSGKTQVRLQLSRWSASTSRTGNARTWSRSTAEEIVYELQSDGTMVRVQEQPYALRRTNAQPENSLYVNTQAASAGVALNTMHDIELDYRIYRDADDVPWISLVITDEAATAEPIRLYAQVYPDDGEEPIYIALPYYERSVSIGGTHSIDMPLSALLDGRSCHKVRVAVHGIDIEERDEADNEILLVLNENIPVLSFALQPQDRIALVGETIALSVKPAGGVKPYTYQWQVARQDGVWTDVEGGTADILSIGPVTKDMQGWRYRCQVTDHYLTRACSDEAKLTVTELPSTGDRSHPGLYLTMAVCSLLALLLLLRRRKHQYE